MTKKTGARLDGRPPADKMTPTEQRIWELHKQGKKRSEIAADLNMKPESVSRRLLAAKEKAFLL